MVGFYKATMASNINMTWRMEGHMECSFGILRGPKGTNMGDICHHSWGTNQVLKIKLKNQSVRILINLVSDRRAYHSNSNGANDTQIWAHIKKLEQVKVNVWLVHMVGLDDVVGSISELGGTKWKVTIGPCIYKITYREREVLQNQPPVGTGLRCDRTSRTTLQNWPQHVWVAMQYHNRKSQHGQNSHIYKTLVLRYLQKDPGCDTTIISS